MAQKDVDAVITRLVKDDDFKDKFERDRSAALSEHDLTDDELNALQDLDVSGLREGVEKIRSSTNVAIGSLYI